MHFLARLQTMTVTKIHWLSLLCVVLGTLPGGAQVTISEFMASNSRTLADEDGDYPDWIELYNESAAAVNLDGWFLTDVATDLRKWRIPALIIPPKGFAVIFASGKNRSNPAARLHTSFNLDADGEYLALVRPDGTGLASEFSPRFPPQRQDISYGTGQDIRTNRFVGTGTSARFLVPVSSALGGSWTAVAFSDASWSAARVGVGYETAVPGFAVRNVKASVAVSSLAAAKSVLGNPSQHLRSVSENAPWLNYYNSGGDGHYGNNRNFPGAPPGADEDDFVVEAVGTITFPAAGSWTLGVSSDDGFELTIGSFILSFPNPRGPGDTLGVFNVPAAGDYECRLIFYERGGGSELEFFAARGSFGGWDQTNFRLVGDTGGGGLAVRSQVVAGGGLSAGSYRPAIVTDVQNQMKDRNATLYLRVPFSIPTPAEVRSLTLRMQYDDGFVAHLNGQEIARRNAPPTPQWNSAAAAPRDRAAALAFEDINLSDRLGLLQPGANVLAIQGLNESPGDGDFLLSPELVEYRIQELAPSYFATATPGAPNSAGFIAFVGDTRFNVDRGFHSAPFDLRITTDTEGASIYYTTNGTVPSPSNGFLHTGPIPIAGTTILRAAAYKAGHQPSNVDTHTYLFLDDVIRQSPTGAPPPGWPTSWGANVRDYGMDPDIVNSPLYSGTIKQDLLTLPSFCVVTDLKHLFDSATGIYANPGQDGRDWERPCSLELIYPDGSRGFQINAGIRIRGGFSRSTQNPKHAFRFFFRQEYGAAKLRYPLFGDAGTDTFDAIDLRTFQNYSWSFQGDSRGIFLRDQFNRDLQLAMGHQGERGDFCHLYINGQYWGLFNTCERPEASYGETYFGGRKENYDVIKVEAGPYTINATDGTLDAWTRLYQAGLAGFASNAAYERIQGNNPDGTPNPAFENLVDVPNLIDYMLIVFYGGNLDAPISNFLGNQSPNNFYAVRDRTGGSGGFKYFVHDAEHTLLDLNRNRIGPFPAGDSSVLKSNPQWIFQKLQANAEFRLRVADHVHRHFFNDGVLTPANLRARFSARRNEIDRAVVAESARWGDAKTASPLTRNQHWLNAINGILNNHLPGRSGVVLNQLRAANLYPPLAAPSFSQHGGAVQPGYPLAVSAPAAAVYYTLDGSDPRLRGGTVSPRARAYSTPLVLNESVVVKSRSFDGSNWSALNEAEFTVIRTFRDLRITEIMYHPPAFNNSDGDEFEFLELKNIATTELDLSGIQFTNGIRYSFPLGTRLGPGQFIILASNPIQFSAKYPGVRVFGAYQGRLSNAGELIALVHAAGAPITSVRFDDDPPWPALADGQGFSLVPVNPASLADANDPAQWRASSRIHGSPGADDVPAGILPVWITEINTHTDPPQVDAIELFNPNPAPADISGWYLSDDFNQPKKFRIPAGTILGPSVYRVFAEASFNPTPGRDPSFTLSSHGESVYLFSADSAGNLTGYSDGFSFGAAANGVSFGRHTTSDGQVHYPAQLTLTLGAPNSGPRVGPVVINEIHYAPAGGNDEFLELKNLTAAPVRLFDPAFPTNRWKIDGIGFDFPPNAEIPAFGLGLVVSGDPAAFRARFAVPANVPVYGPFPGQLQDNGERITLLRPDAPDLETNGATVRIIVPYITVDEVRYGVAAPWPTGATGAGPSIERIAAAAYGNDPANWRASFNIPSPGIENSGNRTPLVDAGPDQSIQSAAFPVAASLAAQILDDGLPNPPGRLTIDWVQISGPASVPLATPSQASTTASIPSPGTFVFRVTASDGALTASDEISVMVQLEPQTLTLIGAGSVWKYLDNGVDQGAAWRAPAFNDAAWKSGPAQLGYGDGDEATVVSFGPNSAAKFTTTYFRRSFSVAAATTIRQLNARLLRDDGAVVYLNGVEVFRSNMPEGAIGFATFASSVMGGADESAFFERGIDPSILVNGNNVVAVEVHQANLDSSDLSFDFELIAKADPQAVNLPPIVDAGPDLTITLPELAALKGAVTDDGLPMPPGRTTNLWSRVSGPGSVIFADPAAAATTAQFSAPGIYVLRLLAGDGAFTASDDISVVARPDALTAWKMTFFTAAELANPAVSGDHADPDSDRLTNQQEFIAGTHPKDPASVLRIIAALPSKSGVAIRIEAVAGKTYTLQARAAVGSGLWQNIVQVPAQNATVLLDLLDVSATAGAARYYRIVTPQAP